jgi:ketosteroid isomerase-like protein
MGELRDILADAADRGAMAEPAMDRMLRRRDVRHRREQIAALTMGAIAGAIAIAIPIVSWGAGSSNQPAAGASGGELPGPSAWVGVVVSVALWLAIAGLGLATFGAIRGQGRAKRGARKGEQDMDSKMERDLRSGPVEVPAIRLDDGRLRRTSRWLLAAVAVLLVALAGLAAFTIATRSDGTSSAMEVDPSVIAALEGVNAAVNDGDTQAYLGWWAEDAELNAQNGDTWQGTDELRTYFAGLADIGVRNVETGDVIGEGRFGAAMTSYEADTVPSGRFLMIVEMNADGTIRWAQQVRQDSPALAGA